MPERDRVCPICHHQAGTTDTYCSSCGTVLHHHDAPGTDLRPAQGSDFAPLMITRPAPPPDLQPLQIVPDTTRQRRRMMKRGVALLLSIAVASVFVLTLLLAGDRQSGTPLRALMIVSGLLTVLLLGAWISFVVKRARKRARRQHWQMSAF